MKKQLALLACVLLSRMLFSQAVPMALKDWETNVGTQTMFQKNVVKTDGSGNVYTAGATLNTNGKYDILLTKVTSGGTAVYTKTVNGTANEHDFALGMFISGTDVFITGAITNNTLTLVPELFIAQYNSSGVQQFFTTYSNGYGDVGANIVYNAATGYMVVTGASYDAGFQSDILTVAFDGSGTQAWAGTNDYNGLNDGGVKITDRGINVIITGVVSDAPNDYRLISLSYNAGTGISTLGTVGAIATSSVEIVADVAKDGSGNLYICGATQQNAGQGYDMYIAKVDNTLTILWEQTINGYSSSPWDDFAKGIQVDGSGNVYLTGVTTQSTQGKNMTTVKLNSSGVIQWSVDENGSFNSHDGGADLALDASNNVYVTGFKTIGTNNTDFYSVKYNSSGTKIWEINEGDDLNDEATNLILDNNDNLIIAGSHEITPGVFEYVTYKYDQHEVITPTDFYGETPNIKRWFYGNRGQLITETGAAVSDIKFYTYNTFPAFYFKQNSQSYVFSRFDTISANSDSLHRIDLTFNNKLETSNTYALEQQDINYLNYYLAHTGTGIEKVYGNKRLITTNLYNNIDLMTCSNQQGIKYYFIVKPGADMRDIQMEFAGATSFSLNGTTNALSINSSIGSITFDKPVAYQLTTANATVAVTSFSPTWATNGASNKYKFNDGAYTSSLTLIIEVDQGSSALGSTGSTNPVWCTDVGSPTYDLVYDIDSDVNGYLYATGWTDNALFPNSAGINSGAWGNHETFIISYKPGGEPRWRTIYGGTGIEQGWNVKVDNTNNMVYMTGWTGYSASSPYNTDFPLRPNGSAYYHTSASGSGVPYYGFITKFQTTNGACKWATLFGDDNAGNTHIYGLDVASNGELYIGGTAQTFAGSGFPHVTPSTGCTVHSEYLHSAQPAFIAKFDASNQLVWATSFGTDTCVIYDLRVNSVNELFITGAAQAYNNANFHIVKEFSNDYQQSYGGGSSDAFVAKFSNCLELKWSTFVGGAKGDAGNAIEVSVGSPAASKTTNTSTYTYISGITKSNTGFPILNNTNTNSINDNSLGGTQDGFIAGFNAVNEQSWATFVGGSNIDELNDMEFGRAGTLFLTGSTKSSDFLNVNFTGGYNQTQLENTTGGDDYDAFVIALDGPSTFTKVWSSFLGGNTSISGYRSDDHGYAITTSNMYVYMGGETWSYNNFPWNADLTTYPNAYYQPYLEGNFSQDGFLAQFDLALTAISVKELAKADPNGFIVYPNPSNGMVYIVLNEDLVHNSKKLNLQVFDIQGREIITKSVNPMSYEDFSLNLSNVSTGMYFVKLSGENLNMSQKIIINH